jgi:histidine ammonia-lyase
MNRGFRCREQNRSSSAMPSSRWQDVVAVARHGATLVCRQHAWARIDNAQAIVQRIVASGERAYGVNTGLGALCNVSLEDEQLSRLSRNTLLSHACGVGPALPDEQTRAIICAAIINYSQGKSGIHRQVVEALLACSIAHHARRCPPRVRWVI